MVSTTTKGDTMDHTITPRMTRHALDRCHEMGLQAKVAKAIFRTPAIVRPATRRGEPSRFPRCMVTSDRFPGYAIVVEDRPTGPWVVTVVFRTTETYDRQGTTYTPRGNQ